MAFPEYIKKNQMHLILNATYAERSVINYLESKKVKFKFQKIIRCGGKKYYLADFYLPRTKTILEVDGKYHYTEEQYLKDQKRAGDLIALGYNVIRISNEDVYEANYDVLNGIILNNKHK